MGGIGRRGEDRTAVILGAPGVVVVAASGMRHQANMRTQARLTFCDASNRLLCP